MNSRQLMTELQSVGLRLAEPHAGVASRRGGAGPSDHKAVTVDGHTTDVLPLSSNSADVRAALIGLNLTGVNDVVVSRAGNTFTFGFLGDEALAASALNVSATSSLATTVTNTVINRVQSIVLNAASGSFTVTIANGATPVNFALTVGASADTVRDAIIAALNPA